SFEEALHEPYRNRLTTHTRLIVSLADIALPYLHVTDLRRSSGFKVFSYNVSAYEVKLQVAFRALQVVTTTLSLVVFCQEPVCIDGGHASIRCSCDCLPVLVVSNITRCEDSRNISLGILSGHNVSLRVEVDLALQEPRVRFIAYRYENPISIDMTIFSALQIVQLNPRHLVVTSNFLDS